MKTKYTILFLLAFAFAACNKEDQSATSIEGLKGKWAPIHEDWLTDKFLEFDKGYLTTHALPGSFFAKGMGLLPRERFEPPHAPAGEPGTAMPDGAETGE